jgi:hypothetical protein
MVLELMSRKQGAAMSEIGKATGWQNHTIRGFISGNVTKKMGLAVESFKNEAGERIYRIIPKTIQTPSTAGEKKRQDPVEVLRAALARRGSD